MGVACFGLLTGCGGSAAVTESAPTASASREGHELAEAGDLSSIPVIPFTLVADYPHDANAWTQGLAYAGPDRIYEGTGDYENSSLREVVLSTGDVVRMVPLPSPQMYGEGITVWGETILQLTWRSGIGLVTRASDFEGLGEFRYPAGGDGLPQEGWGLTTDGANLYVSDGTEFIYVADAEQTLARGELAVTGVVTVTWDGQAVSRLNELEYVDGQIYANVWQTDTIVRFDAGNGTVDGRLDISGLLTASERRLADTSNGIAQNPVTGEMLVTGKKWPRIFALRLG